VLPRVRDGQLVRSQMGTVGGVSVGVWKLQVSDCRKRVMIGGTEGVAV
jgi:hypothetical protein